MAHRKLVCLFALVAALSLVTAASPWSLAKTPDPESSSSDQPVVIRLYVNDRDHLNAVAGRLDIWESHPDELYVVAAVQPAQLQWLQDLGYRVEIDPEKTALLGPEAPLDPRFYYFDDDYPNSYDRYMVDFMAGTAAAYPDITEILDIGDAWQGLHGGYARDIWVLRITNEDPAYGPIEDKPVLYMHAGIHAREVTIPEMAIRYIKYLTSGYDDLGGYGIDPDVTWLVNHNVAYVLVTTNPDGHRVDEANTSANRRKNMNNTLCPSGNFGIDLNRNHSFLWGCCGGSSGNSCDDTYRGASRASEPETQAFEAHLVSVIPDQNGPNGDDEIPVAAPITTTGLLLSLHSYSDLTLFPWGFSGYGDPPNLAGLSTIGHKFAFYTGYDTFTIWYDVDGDTHDWAYGKLGIPAYTFEIGPQSGTCGGFFPPYECMEGASGYPRNFWAETRPAFIYAHKIVRTPYVTAYGPDAQNLAVSPASVPQGTPVDLTANLMDHRCCGEPLGPIAAAEYFLDAPGEDGTGLAMTPVDGAWGETNEDGQATVDTSSLAPGRHYILVHGQNSAGQWGPFTAVFVDTTPGFAPEQIGVTASPLDIPIVHGQSTVTAALTLLDGTPVPGWPVTFTTDAGSLSPETVYSDENGHAVTTLTAGPAAATAHVNAEASAALQDSVDVNFYVPDAPTAAFASNSPQCIGLPAIFTNQTSGPPEVPIDYEWAFGDGATSTEVSPQHTYATAGAYTVVLTATNVGGSDVATDLFTVDPLPEVGFTWSPLNPLAGQLVQFTDTTGHDPIAWDWDFGDGGGATARNPGHVFVTAGQYVVSLQARNACGWSAPLEQTVTVVDEPDEPIDGLIATNDSPTFIGYTTLLSATITAGTNVGYVWDLGDGSPALAGQYVSHVYPAPGRYTATVTASNNSNSLEAETAVVIVGQYLYVYLPIVSK